MPNHVLSPDAQAIMLLCASFGENRNLQPQPLTLSEYNRLAKVLIENQLRPEYLLSAKGLDILPKINDKKLNYERLVALLERGGILAITLEKWVNQGLWIITRSDKNYPIKLKQNLQHLAPVIIYGVGNIELLEKGGLAIVGSRDINEEEIEYTKKIVKVCASQGINVISGGAKGIDQEAMLGTLEVGGTAVGVLADSLNKASVSRKYRDSIRDGKLTLISSYDPNARFTVGNAMGRNKYIYALSNYALVVSSSLNKGGTWAGATEVLQKYQKIPVFVKVEGKVKEGNQALLDRGAKSFPREPWNDDLKELLLVSETQSNLLENNSSSKWEISENISGKISELESEPLLYLLANNSSSELETSVNISEETNESELEPQSDLSENDLLSELETPINISGKTSELELEPQSNLSELETAVNISSKTSELELEPQSNLSENDLLPELETSVNISAKTTQLKSESQSNLSENNSLPEFPSLVNISGKTSKSKVETNSNLSIPKTTNQIIYEKVLPIILENLIQPQNAKYLSKILEVRVRQLDKWLKISTEEGKIIKTQNPVNYIIAAENQEHKNYQTSTQQLSIYEAVLPIILENLEKPQTDKDLAIKLNVNITQLQDWLTTAKKEGKIISENKSNTYVISQEKYTEQLSLFDTVEDDEEGLDW